MQQFANEVLQLLRVAGSKLASRWPTLVALVLAGFAAKLVTLKVAMLAGRLAWVLGVLVFAFTAAALLAAIIYMFRTIAPTVQTASFPAVLAPFLVVFLATDHFDGYLIHPALERPVVMDAAAASVLIVAVAARWTMPLWKSVNAKPWAVWVRLGLDILWMSLLAFTIATHPLSLWLVDLAEPVSWVFSMAFAALVVPLAWLVTGAFALGYRLGDLTWLVRVTGLPLVLATCMLILILQKLPLLLWELERLGAGARDPQTFWQPLTGVIGAANAAFGVLLVVCLVSALLDRSGGDEAGVSGQGGVTYYSDSDRLGVGRRDEQDGHLIGV